ARLIAQATPAATAALQSLGLTLNPDQLGRARTLLHSVSFGTVARLGGNLVGILNRLRDANVQQNLDSLGSDLASVAQVVLLALAEGADVLAKLVDSVPSKFTIDELKEIQKLTVDAIRSILKNLPYVLGLEPDARKNLYAVFGSLGFGGSIQSMTTAGNFVTTETNLGVFFAQVSAGGLPSGRWEIGEGMTLRREGDGPYIFEYEDKSVHFSDTDSNETTIKTRLRGEEGGEEANLTSDKIEGRIKNIKSEPNNGAASLIIETDVKTVRVTIGNGVPTRIDFFDGIDADLQKAPVKMIVYLSRSTVTVENGQKMTIKTTSGSTFSVNLDAAVDMRGAMPISEGPNGEIIFKDVDGNEHTIKLLKSKFYVKSYKIVSSPKGASGATVYTPQGEVVAEFAGVTDVQDAVDPAGGITVNGPGAQQILIQDVVDREGNVSKTEIKYTIGDQVFTVDVTKVGDNLEVVTKISNGSFVESFDGPVTVSIQNGGVLFTGARLGSKQPISILVLVDPITGAASHTIVEISGQKFGKVVQTINPELPVGTTFFVTPEGGIVFVNAEGHVIQTFGNVGAIEVNTKKPNQVVYINNGVVDGVRGGAVIYDSEGIIVGTVGAVGPYTVGGHITVLEGVAGTRVIGGRGVIQTNLYRGTLAIPDSASSAYVIENSNLSGGVDQTVIYQDGRILMRSTNASGNLVFENVLFGGIYYTVLSSGTVQLARPTAAGLYTIIYFPSGLVNINGNNVTVPINAENVPAEIVPAQKGVYVVTGNGVQFIANAIEIQTAKVTAQTVYQLTEPQVTAAVTAIQAVSGLPITAANIAAVTAIQDANKVLVNPIPLNSVTASVIASIIEAKHLT
ncbi:MAG: hypothetical protein HY584_02670, partial [Candidatus Omnitrophica bacterium]|nr:hypothetical protein [Candidatus Omnitrophota bacterium]